MKLTTTLKIILAILSLLVCFLIIKYSKEHKKYLVLKARLVKNVAYIQHIEEIIADYERNLSQINIKDYENAKINPTADEKVKFCIVVPSYNNVNYAQQNLNSVFRQNYHNWRLIYIDDASTDGMSELLTTIKNRSRLEDTKFTLIRNEERKRAASYAFYYAAHNLCSDNEVMVFLDGDDLLATTNVLNKLAKYYKNPNIWLTYGSYLEIPKIQMGCEFAKEISTEDFTNIRSLPWSFSHLRTSYTWLFKKIALNDLQYQGKFISTSWDLAIMFPMLEMAGKDRIQFISDILYIYRIHRTNDGILYSKEQKEMEKYIRKLPKYDRITSDH